MFHSLIYLFNILFSSILMLPQHLDEYGKQEDFKSCEQCTSVKLSCDTISNSLDSFPLLKSRPLLKIYTNAFQFAKMTFKTLM